MSKTTKSVNRSLGKQLSFHIRTYGCQMNEYDSQLVTSILSEDGFALAEDEQSADIVLLNTCSVRQHAENRVYGHLQRLATARRNIDIIVGVIGCMAQSARDELLDGRLGVDLVAGPDTYRSLTRLIHSVRDSCCPAMAVESADRETYDDIAAWPDDSVNAWIAIMRGCDNYCSFCVVPYTRGRERSRSPQSVVDEARRLAADGISQVTLLGQNVNSYRYDNHTFAQLITSVADIPEIKRVRFTSPHPKDFPTDILYMMRDHPNICKHIHLPVQAGSDRILSMMNRNYTAKEFLRLVDTIRQAMPEVTLTTDVIVGFPTESRAEFDQTVDLMRTVRFDSAFIFNYSPRPHTKAQRCWADDIPAAEKKYRITSLNELQNEISLKQNRRHIGEICEALVEGESRRNEAEWFGRTDGNKVVVFSHGGEKMGDYIKVEIVDATPNTLKGVRLT